MTARTANEQRIASLEAEVVTLREAMKPAQREMSNAYRLGLVDSLAPKSEASSFTQACGLLTSALSSSTDYSGKVVVDRQFLGEVRDILEAAFQAANVGTYVSKYSAHLARLDSLRKADAATDAVHPEGGKT